jgi:ribosomal protein S18 acetylase RimI-like enzyme
MTGLPGGTPAGHRCPPPAAAVREETDPDRKQALCRAVLADLPLWFGLPDSNREYELGVRDLEFLVAERDGEAAGFLALKRHNEWTAEIWVMGLFARCHGQGLGRRLVEDAATRLRAEGIRFLSVKTLDASRPSPEYDRTRRFYRGAGFLPLETLPELWGPENPCLLLVKPL